MSRTPAVSLALVLLPFLLLACPPTHRPDDDDAADDDSAAGDDDSVADDDAADDDAADDDAADDDAADDDDAGNGCDGLVVTLGGDGAVCETPWTEAGVELMLANNCTSGTCSGEQGGGDVWIYPATLKADFGTLSCDVTSVEVDLTDFAGAGAATVTLVDGDGNALGAGANSSVGSMETISATATGGPASGMGICGYETQVHEIRLF